MIMEMQLRIENNTTLGNIQKQFNDVFPFLKLEFSRTSNSLGSFGNNESTQSAVLKNAAINETPVDISIDKHITVALLKEEFLQKAGLVTQVFRKAGTVWIGTYLTSDWTLEQQNSEGESLSNH